MHHARAVDDLEGLRDARDQHEHGARGGRAPFSATAAAKWLEHRAGCGLAQCRVVPRRHAIRVVTSSGGGRSQGGGVRPGRQLWLGAGETDAPAAGAACAAGVAEADGEAEGVVDEVADGVADGVGVAEGTGRQVTSSRGV